MFNEVAHVVFRLLWAWLSIGCVTSVFVDPVSHGKHHPHSRNDYKTLYFRQPVDHFSYATTDTFLQRYLLNDKYFEAEGPIFFYTGNEGDIVWFYENTGIMLEWAAELTALLVFAEHRYYGESSPYGNDSFKGLKHVGYLSSEQALADFVSLIDYVKRTVHGAGDSPVIAFGGSYGGMLAAWLRIKYPHSVIGALAASAPVWQFGSLVPCDRFHQIVTRDFNASSADCVVNIRRSWKRITDLGANEAGRRRLTQTLRLCQPLKSVDDVSTLKDWLSETWAYLAMVDYPYPTSFLQPLPAWPVQKACSYLMNKSVNTDELLINIHDAVNVFYNYTGNRRCFNISQVDTAGEVNYIAWSFQECTEMVMPLCTDGVHDMFEPKPWNFSLYSSECYKLWGILPRPEWIIEEYGGKNISSASNIIFSNGDLDPWSAGGVLNSPGPSLFTILIKDAAHHLDLRASHVDDIPSVLEARHKEKSIITNWIKHYTSQRLISLDRHPDRQPKKQVDNRLKVAYFTDLNEPCYQVASQSTWWLSTINNLQIFLIIGTVSVLVLLLVAFSHHHKLTVDSNLDKLSLL